MSLVEAIVLGIVQGLTEFLPISSSGHLILVPWLLGWDRPGLKFDASLHLGTLLAVIVYFWRELLAMFRAAPLALARPRAVLKGSSSSGEGIHAVDGASVDDRSSDARLALLLILGSLPGGIVGLLGQGAIDDFFHGDGHQSRAIIVIALLLIVFAGVLLIAERTGRFRRRIADLGPRDALMLGLAQAVALLPGVSRSGVTISAGLFVGMRRADAARFSFLLGTPLVAAAGLKALGDTIQAGMTGAEARTFAIGIAASFLSGIAAISVLLRYLQRASTAVFVFYRIVAGLAVLGLLATGIK